MSGTLDSGTRRLSDSATESTNVGVIDSAVGGEVASMLWGVKDNKASWLEDFLVDLAGKNVNPFEADRQDQDLHPWREWRQQEEALETLNPFLSPAALRSNAGPLRLRAEI